MFHSSNVEHAYHVLGVSTNDSWETIRLKYKRLLLQNHPDKVGASSTCHEDFVAIQEAYRCLQDNEMNGTHVKSHVEDRTTCGVSDSTSRNFAWSSYGTMAKRMILGSLPTEMRQLVHTISSHVESLTNHTTQLNYSSIDTWSKLLSQYSPSIVHSLWSIVQSSPDKFTCISIPCHCADIVTHSTIDVTCRRKNKEGNMEKVRCSLPLGKQEFFLFPGRGDFHKEHDSYRDMAVMIHPIEQQRNWLTILYDSRALVIDSNVKDEQLNSMGLPKNVHTALQHALTSLADNHEFHEISIQPMWESFHLRVVRNPTKTT